MNTLISQALFEYCLRIGDTSLISGQRLGEWCGHGPALEEDIALSNMALDLIGQSRIILSYAGKIEGKGRSEDDLAYHRDERQFRNFLLAEQPNGDFATTMVINFFLSAYRFHWYEGLKKSKDDTLCGFAEKSWKEVAYHLRHCTDWMLRLGDGTSESHKKLQDAVNELWIFVDDLFQEDDFDKQLVAEGISFDIAELKRNWNQTVDVVFSKSFLTKPDLNGFMQCGSREGKHTEHLGFLLAEMQFLPRAYPDAKW